jgi:alkylated DNA nucleotide flippase Atl1
MTENAYIEALSKIPKGETRTYGEIARLAGRPTGARAAGRAVSACPSDAKTPWHRAVTADGGLSIDPERAASQLERLRKEGARPKEGESVVKWARRTKAAFVGDWKGRRFAAFDHERVAGFDPERVERMASAADAKARGFAPIEAPRTRTAREPKTAAAPRKSGATPAKSSGSSATTRAKADRGKAERLMPAPLPAFSHEDVADVRNGLDAIDWDTALVSLRQMGAFVAPDLVAPTTCTTLTDLWDEDELFERTIEMGPRGYGIGTYRYWKEPIPAPAAEIRTRVYDELRALAAELTHSPQFPRDYEQFMDMGHSAGQLRSSCILLRYEEGGVNHPHRDIYGPVWFPYQALVVLSERGRDFRGGEFALYDKDPAGARIERTFPLDQGDLCIFASKSCRRTVNRRERWVELEHGMTPVTHGVRFAFGIVLHPAQ